MSIVSTILLALALLLVADFVRWKILVGRELKRRDFVRVRALAIRITPSKGFRLIEACICARHGKEYQVVILNYGWLRTQPSFGVVEI